MAFWTNYASLVQHASGGIGNVWSGNTYTWVRNSGGTSGWRFNAGNFANMVSQATWQGTDGQDAGSTFTTLTSPHCFGLTLKPQLRAWLPRCPRPPGEASEVPGRPGHPVPAARCAPARPRRRAHGISRPHPRLLGGAEQCAIMLNPAWVVYERGTTCSDTAFRADLPGAGVGGGTGHRNPERHGDHRRHRVQGHRVQPVRVRVLAVGVSRQAARRRSGQTFGLWQVTGASTGTFVPGTLLTSGTLTPGEWNCVTYSTIPPLTPNVPYRAVAGFTGPYPSTLNEWNTGGPYAAGIVNGPLTVYSDPTGSLADPYGSPQSSLGSAGSDPTANYPGGANSAFNAWIDVEITGGS